MESPKKPAINSQKLTKEIIICIVVVVLITIIAFAINAMRPKDDPLDDYKKLYNTVLSYDYSKGRDADLEKRIDRAIENSTYIRYYFNLKAKLYYFYKLKNYHLVASNLDELYSYVISPEEQKELLEWYMKVYARFNNQEKVAEYQEKYIEYYDGEFDVESAILEEDTNN